MLLYVLLEQPFRVKTLRFVRFRPYIDLTFLFSPKK